MSGWGKKPESQKEKGEKKPLEPKKKSAEKAEFSADKHSHKKFDKFKKGEK